MPPPAPVPLIAYPRWLRASEPGSGGPGPGGTPFDEWVGELRALFCLPEDRVMLQDMIARGVNVTVFDRLYFQDFVFDGKKWKQEDSPAYGSADETSIKLLRGYDAVADAITLVHENVHTRQPPDLGTLPAELEAYVAEETWAIAHGISENDERCRMRDADGRLVPNPDGIREKIYEMYPSIEAPADDGEPAGKIVAVEGDLVVIRLDDGTERRRPAEAGDALEGKEVAEPRGGRVLDLRRLL